MRTNSWMNYVDGSKLVSELTIPGTHDSATYTAAQITGAGYVKTQSLTFTEQLNAGCRFLDIRAREFKNNLVLHHGAFYLDLNFNDVLNDCKNFLRDNPSETILMSVKEEYDADGNNITYEQAFMKYYNEEPTIWYTENKIPKLNDVRSKIVLLRRFSLDPGSAPLGIDMSFKDNTSFCYQFRTNPTQTLICEDRYNPNSLDEKLSAIAKNVSTAENNTDANNLFLTFTSGYMTLKYTPKGMANEVNAWMMTNLPLNNKNKGIFACDFIDGSLAVFLVNNNFAVTSGYILLSANGGIHTFGKAEYYGHGVGGDEPARRIAITPSGKGYWILSANGGIHTFGDASYEGHGVGKDNQAVGFATTPSGKGYWILSANGGIHTYGDASYEGHGVGGDNSAVAMTITPSGKGYWILSANGGIHTYGDATYYGHGVGGDNPAVDIVVTPSGKGYWILSSNGGIHTYGDAEYYGHGVAGHEAVAMMRNKEGNGYYLFCDNGSVFNYGNTAFLGQGIGSDNAAVSGA